MWFSETSREREKGFSMPELIATVVIISVLAAVAIPLTIRQRAKGVEASMQTQLLSASTTLQQTLSGWRGTPPDQVNITTSGGSWSAVNASNNTTVYASGDVSDGSTVTGTIWANGSYCVQATNPGTSETLNFRSDTKQVSAGACPTEPFGGGGTIPEPEVSGVPNAPTGVTATSPTPNTITISWTAIPSVTQYTVMVPGKNAVATTDTTATIVNVRPGNIAVQVRATNASGTGPSTTKEVLVTGPELYQNDTGNLFTQGVTVNNGGATITGTTTANGNITGSGNLTRTGSASFTSTGSFGNTLSVTAGGANITGNETVTGNTTTTGTGYYGNQLTVNYGGADITGAVDVTGDIVGNGSLSRTGGGSFGNTLSVTSGGANITGNTAVTGNITGTGSVNRTGSATFSSTGQFGGHLTVTSGGASITGDITGAGNLTRTGAASFTSTGSFGNTLSVSAGGANITGDVSTNGSIFLNSTGALGGLRIQRGSSDSWAALLTPITMNGTVRDGNQLYFNANSSTWTTEGNQGVEGNLSTTGSGTIGNGLTVTSGNLNLSMGGLNSVGNIGTFGSVAALGNGVYNGYVAAGGTPASPSSGAVHSTNWFRSVNNTGWYNSTYNTGIYSNANNQVRTYPGSGFISDQYLAATTSVMAGQMGASASTNPGFMFWGGLGIAGLGYNSSNDNVWLKVASGRNVVFDGADSTAGGDRGLHPGQGSTNLGRPSQRWNTLWLVNGASTTSDRRLKTDISDLTPAEVRAALTVEQGIVGFRKLDAPDTVKQRRMGIIAQEVKEALDKEGLDWRNYNFLSYEHIEKEYRSQSNIDNLVPGEEDGFWAVNMESINFFIDAAQRERLNNQEKKIAALEEKVSSMDERLAKLEAAVGVDSASGETPAPETSASPAAKAKGKALTKKK